MKLPAVPDAQPAKTTTTGSFLGLKVAAVIVLIALLFWVGVYDEPVFTFLTASWHKLFSAVGVADRLSVVQQGVSGEVTKRSLPAVFTYALLYTSVCLLLLRLLLPAHRRRLVLTLYGVVFCCCAVLLLAGKLSGVVWPYQLGRRLIDFIVSPLPIIVLVPLLRWYAPGPSK